jgi:RimJ/RimL family protein N-acetyltransferase
MSGSTEDMAHGPDGGEPAIIAEGELVALGPLRRDLVPLYARWENDPEVMRRVGSYRPSTAEGEREWYDAHHKDERSITFTVYERSTLRPVGTATLGHVDHRHGTAEFGLLIGEADARGRGYGTETTRLVLRYAFDLAGLHSVALGVYEFNEAAIRAYRRAGFQEVGRLREIYLYGGRRWDEIRMDCLAPDFRARYPSDTF